MGTDAAASLEILDPPAGYRAPYAWAEVTLLRDYVLFDLLAGARTGDPRLAVVAVRPFAWNPGDEVDPDTTELWASEVHDVCAAYFERTGREALQLVALLGAMNALNGTHPHATRLRFRFY